VSYDEFFKFTVKLLQRAAAADQLEYTCVVHTESPIFYQMHALSPYLDPEDALRLMKAELKLAVIDAIMNGKWEVEVG
jgi:hypothetical protein